MPIYEYECQKCGKTFEVIQKMSDPELKKHEGCGGALTKLISAAGFQFKGTGWYVTDYARKSESSSESSGSKDAKDSNGKKETETKKSEASSTKEGGKASETKPSTESKPAKPSAKKD